MYKKHDARAELLFWLLGHVHSSPDIFETTDFRNESAFTRNQWNRPPKQHPLETSFQSGLGLCQRQSG